MFLPRDREKKDARSLCSETPSQRVPTAVQRDFGARTKARLSKDTGPEIPPEGCADGGSRPSVGVQGSGSSQRGLDMDGSPGGEALASFPAFFPRLPGLPPAPKCPLSTHVCGDGSAFLVLTSLVQTSPAE